MSVRQEPGIRSQESVRICLAAAALLGLVGAAPAADEPVYVRKGSRAETIRATLHVNGMPTLGGIWHWVGPFDNAGNVGFVRGHAPEKGIDLGQAYAGKGGQEVRWREFKEFELGKVVNLARFPDHANSCVYLYHAFDAAEALTLPLSLGSDDQISVWLNGKRVLNLDVVRAAAPDQDRVDLKLKPGKNELLIKVCNVAGEFAVYVHPELPKALPAKVTRQLDRDFPPPSAGENNSVTAAEAEHYRIDTLPVPDDIVLEVGGLAFRPDGKLLCCTRRGDVWLISGTDSGNLDSVTYKRFAAGLHEALGMWVQDDHTLYVVQRPELTRLVDKDGDGFAEEFKTVCDSWGVSGDYHEFAFGPARDKEGNFFVTLNVGFGGGHQAKGAWRGWCVKISPDGKMEPWATGLRSPNGVNFSPDGDLFYCDNQGEWVATNKMHHIRRGEFYGHQAGLRWLKYSPFADALPQSPPSGMLYDGQKGPGGVSGMPELTPPCIWFPYGRMGQSVSEPVWDTTGGKFGPFAGQCFVGDQTKSNIMRVALEKVNGRYQGACFPFRSGFQCGINRLAFAPDGVLYAGQTNRGWGSVGGKPYGLQRLTYTGELPFETHTMSLTPEGFVLTFTKPLDAATASRPEAYSVQSYTYAYFGNYGSPEFDRRGEKIEAVKVAPDRKSVALTVSGLRRGRVYELQLDGVRSEDGDAVLHPEAYYTLNELREAAPGR